MEKYLVCYFSASGNTKMAAEKIRDVVKGDLFEIVPLLPYSDEDLDWTNKESRSSREMNDLSYRPEVSQKVSNLENYNKVIIGFPIWWYTAPTIINTFIEENDLTGKDVYVFATSGSSSVDKSFNDLKKSYPNLNFIKGVRFNRIVSEREILDWIN